MRHDRTVERQTEKARSVRVARDTEEIAHLVEALVRKDPRPEAIRAGFAELSTEGTIGFEDLWWINDLVGQVVGPAASGSQSRVVRGASPIATGPGTPLAGNVRAALERAFSVDLGSIRVHAGPEGKAVTSTLQAEAAASGRDIFVRDVASASNLPLMAHEVTHVLVGTHDVALQDITGPSPDPAHVETHLIEVTASLAATPVDFAVLFRRVQEALSAAVTVMEQSSAPGVLAQAANLMEALHEMVGRSLVPAVNDNTVVPAEQRQPVPLPQAGVVTQIADLVRRCQTAAVGTTMDISQQVAQANDALLATLQAISVEGARDTWGQRVDTNSPGLQTLLTEGSGGEFGTGGVPEWCGIFVSAHYHSAGFDEEMRRGLYHALNVQDMFRYRQATNAARAPAAIWDPAENRWRGLLEYHRARGSERKWQNSAAVSAVAASGDWTRLDIRAGDVVLIDHQADGTADHITMVESWDARTGMLRTIEGNTRGGIIPEGWRPSGSNVGVHERDLTNNSQRAKIFGVGRPSLVDFEEHDYLVVTPPQELANLSPEEITQLAGGNIPAALQLLTRQRQQQLQRWAQNNRVRE